jgi:hypothetical protein
MSSPRSPRTVALILSAPRPYRRTATHTCSVRAGQGVFVPGWGTECSTIEKPPFFARTDAKLKTCARRDVKRHFSDGRLTIDDEPVRHVRSFERASPVFRFQMPKRNFLGLRKRSGRGAAFGAGFLLRGLAVGAHIVQRSDRYQQFRYVTTYKIEVKG